MSEPGAGRATGAVRDATAWPAAEDDTATTDQQRPSGPDAALDRWADRDVEDWRRAWRLPHLVIYRAVGSTNDVARGLAEQGAPGGTTVMAEQQRRGRGQHGRLWRAPPATSVLLSMVLRPRRLSGRGAAPGTVPIRVGLAVARSLEALAAVPVGLKWPNDVVVGERKLGGILCEGAVGARAPYIIAGVGINVLQAEGELPDVPDPGATSLRLASGRPIGCSEVAGAVARALAGLGEDAAGPLSAAELRDFHARDILRGRAVRIDGVAAGTAAGLAADGALLVRGTGGTVRYHSGTVRPDSRFHDATP